MKAELAALLIINLSALTIFGFSAVGQGNVHIPGDHGICLAAKAKGQPCPGRGNVFPFLAFHFEAFKTFSNVLLLFFVLILIVGLSAGRELKLLIAGAGYLIWQFLESRSRPFQRDFLYWLALRENSPTLFWRTAARTVCSLG